MKNSIFVGLSVLAVVGLLITVSSMSSNDTEPKIHTNSLGVRHKLSVHKSATCGCCALWVNYMKSKGYEIEVSDSKYVEKIKKKHNVPEELYACHTTIINDGEYFVEGHIPEESILKLMEEQPDIYGIGMPGMPSGSPGMPGTKDGPFRIMQLDKAKEVNLFEER